MYHEIPEALRALIEPVVADHDCELVDAEFLSGPRAPRVRVVVDTLQGDGRVTAERCVEISRELGTHLDVAALLPRNYRLEVASPGLDRVLAREKDFAAVCGSEVKLETVEPQQGRRHFRGQLLAFADGVLQMRVDGAELAIPFRAVKRANRVYAFSRADFARPGHRRVGAARSSKRRARRSATPEGAGR